MKKLSFFIALITVGTLCHAQTNLVVTPGRPQAGDVIKIQYTPSGDLANTMSKVEAAVYITGSKGRIADDLLLTKSGKKYTATIATDTSTRFIQLAFYANEKYDNNFNEGYYIQLYAGDKIKKGSYASLANLYQYFANDSRIDKDETRALAAFEKEFELYPQQRRPLALNYYSLLSKTNPDAGSVIQSAINEATQSGLKREEDYIYLERLYNAAKLRDEALKIKNTRLEKFPDGKFSFDDQIDQYQNTKDTIEREKLYAALEQKIKNDEALKNYQWLIDNHSTMMAAKSARRRDWQSYKNHLNAIANKKIIAANYNSMAWYLQEKNQDLAVAEELAKWAVDFTNNERTNPTAAKPAYLTTKQWAKARESEYAMYADTYAMVLHRAGKTKEGFPFATEAALTIKKGLDSDLNNTYALLAEKQLPRAEAKVQLENFVKTGHASKDVNAILRKFYIEENKGEEGFDKYLSDLAHEAYLKMLEDLKKSMIKEVAPSVALTDLNGKKVSINDLKGKIVVVDFWATWCGPCKASFPAMQKVVTRYAGNDNVKFVFVNTWERVEDKEKNASEFIQTNKYTFDVWMDKENQLVEKFKVDGIPTKFVLDKDGNIRFKSVGFSGSDEHLASELGAMIEMAGGEKAF